MHSRPPALLLLLSLTALVVLAAAAAHGALYTFSSAFTLNTVADFEAVDVIGAVPDNGGTSIIEGLSSIKLLNVSVAFGKNTKLIVRNVQTDVGIYIASWFDDGTEVLVHNNRVPAQSTNAPAFYFNSRVHGRMRRVDVVDNYFRRISQLQEAFRAVIVFMPYVTGAGPATDAESIDAVSIQRNEAHCSPLDGGTCTAIVVAQNYHLHQPRIGSVTISSVFSKVRGLYSPYPPVLAFLNFSVTSSLSVLNVSSNDIHVDSGQNEFGIAISNAANSSRIIVENNTAVLNPIQLDENPLNVSFLIVGGDASLDQTLNESTSNATAVTRARLRPLSPAHSLVISRNVVVFASMNANRSFGVFLDGLRDIPLISIVANRINVSSQVDTAHGILIGNVTNVTALAIENNTISAGGVGNSRSTCVEFYGPTQGVPALAVANNALELYGTRALVQGVRFSGAHAGVDALSAANLTVAILATVRKTVEVVSLSGGFVADGVGSLTVTSVQPTTPFGSAARATA